MARRLTYEEVKNFVEVESGSGCKLLSKEYVNSREKLKFQCGCGINEFETEFTTFKSMNKRQCNDCGMAIRSENRTKTNEEFLSDIYRLVGDEYTFLEEYIDAKIKIKCRHNTCGHVYSVRPNNFISGRRCPQCFGKSLKTNKRFIKEVHDLVGDEYVFLQKYIRSSIPILCKHLKCGHEWYARPDSFLIGKRCPNCNGGVLKLDSEFTNKIYSLVGDEYVFLEGYVTAKTKIMCKHNTCGYEWEINPNNFINGNRCPQCAESKGEQYVRKYLQNKNINFQQEYTFEDLLSDKDNPLRFDFAIFDIKENIIFLIEYDGIFHYEQQYDDDGFEVLQIHDERKNEYCKGNDIPLLRIPYWDFDNIEQILEDWLGRHNMYVKQADSA